MKQGWEIRPFEKCIEKVKYTTKIATCDYSTMGAYPVVSQEEEYISGYWNNAEDVFKVSKPVVIFGDHTRVLKYVDFDFVLGADGVKILQPIDAINAKFFFYDLIASKIPSLGYSRHYKLLKELNVPVPPIAEQEKIVAELDCLSGIIEKKKQQLKELDNLAHSIFYEMFGDPVENDKGWEKKRLGDLADISSSKRIFANEYTETGVPFYRGKEVTEKSKGNEISVELFISEDRYNEIKRIYGVPVVGDILVTAVGTIGNIWVVDSEEPFYFKDGNVLWMKIKNNSHPVYFKYLLSVLIDEYKEQMANGCAYSALTIVNLKEMPTAIVPLTLQQDFASKIEVIEKQKELIALSVKEVETLFNSRIELYFN